MFVFLMLQCYKADVEEAVHASLLAASDDFLISTFNPEERRAAVGYICTVIFAVGFIK